MVNGLGVVGWGVGGIEAEAAMLGQPSSMLIPHGRRLSGCRPRVPQGTTATDLVLTITEAAAQARRRRQVRGVLRSRGLSALTIADRATLGNMCPECGATVAIFPIDEMTLRIFLRSHWSCGRKRKAALVEAHARAQGLFRTADWWMRLTRGNHRAGSVDGGAEPGWPASRYQGSRAAGRAKRASFAALPRRAAECPRRWPRPQAARLSPTQIVLEHGSVVIAAITSCTNTPNRA